LDGHTAPPIENQNIPSCQLRCIEQFNCGKAGKPSVFRNERSTTGGFPCPLSRSLPAIPTARGGREISKGQ